EARLMLDKELTEVESAALAIKMRRNSIAPIHRLPSEIFAKVFSILCQSHAPSTFSTWELGWITVTHVCRHWRQIAFDNPSLWGTNIISHPMWIEERLSRSKNSPITLDISFHP
ncbi:hypothetical protein FA95DRAFT_1461369, partial [Auriscalpium vulgare]